MQGAGIAFVFPVELHVVGEVDLIFFFVVILSSFIVFRMDRILNLVHLLLLPKLYMLDSLWPRMVSASFKTQELRVVGNVDLIFLVVIILSIFNAFRMDRILNLVHSFR